MGRVVAEIEKSMDGMFDKALFTRVVFPVPLGPVTTNRAPLLGTFQPLIFKASSVEYV